MDCPAQLTDGHIGTVTQFDAAAIWYFDEDTEGWTGASWSTGGYLAPTGALVSPSGLEIPAGIYAQVRLRVQKSATISWTGYLWWAASGQGWDTGRRIAIPEPVWSGEEGLITLSPDWVGEIDRIRLDVPTSDLLVDWLAVGRPAPGASSAELAALRRTVIDADEALAEDITQLQTGLTDAAGDMAGLAGAVDSLEARVTETEDNRMIYGVYSGFLVRSSQGEQLLIPPRSSIPSFAKSPIAGSARRAARCWTPSPVARCAALSPPALAAPTSERTPRRTGGRKPGAG